MEEISMKKIIARIFLGGILIVGFTACSGEAADENVLRVGVDLKFPPFSYLDADGNPAGFEIDVAEAFGEFIEKDVEIVNTDFSLLLPALETGDVDILIADMGKSEERAKKADFSDPYRYTYRLGVINKDFAQEHGITNSTPESEIFAIEGAKFVGLAGTKGVSYPQSMGADVTEVTEIGIALIEISNGQSDVLLTSNEAFAFQAADPENRVVYTGSNYQEGSSFVVRLGDKQLLDQANEFIASMYEEGGLYDQLAPKYDPIIAEFLLNPELGLNFIVDPIE